MPAPHTAAAVPRPALQPGQVAVLRAGGAAFEVRQPGDRAAADRAALLPLAAQLAAIPASQSVGGAGTGAPPAPTVDTRVRLLEQAVAHLLGLLGVGAPPNP